jgi:hypothetical protein
MNPYLYVTQIPPTPTPLPTIAMINQWYIGGVGPLTDGQLILLGIASLFCLAVLAVIFAPVEIYD